MRQKSGMTLRRAADAIGISHCMISHIEVGREDVPTRRLEAMVTAYGYTMEDFSAYLEGRKMPLNYRDECVELVHGLDQEKLKSVHALLCSFGR